MLTNWKKGWKVLSPDRRSCTYMCRSPKSVCSYPKNKVIRQRKGCGPLAVFHTRARAREFGDGCGDKIVKCLYIPSKFTTLWERALVQRYNNLLLDHQEVEQKLSLGGVPHGTDFAYAVKCLE